MKLALAQINTRVGAIDSNTDSLIHAANRARDEHRADLIVFPELTLSGYPPEDLLLHKGLRRRVEDAAARVLAGVRGITVCFGLPEYVGDRIFNSAVVVRDGRMLVTHRKWILPNYAVFDEKRYFESGAEPSCFECAGVRFNPIRHLVCLHIRWFLS